MFTLRYATEADFVGFCELPLTYRVRAFAAVQGDEVLGVGGLAFMPDGVVGAFVHAKDEARRFKVAAHKAGLRAMSEARALGLRRVVAIACPNVEASERWLARLGFHTEGEIAAGGKVFIWQS